MIKKIVTAVTVGLLLITANAHSASVKLGFVTTLSTPAAVIGNDMRDAVELALEHINHKMGPADVEVVYADDEFNPQKGKQATERVLAQEKVDLVFGYIWSHVLLASASTVLDSGKILISANAGPSPLAGKGCHKNFFNISWQNDQTPMAMGEVLNQRGVKTLYVIAPLYAAGKNMVTGVKRTFKGEIVGEDMTKWPDQIDWAAELAKVKAANPDGVFIFYPGKHGPAFIKQYQQSGLAGKIELFTVFTIDSISLPRFQAAEMNGVLGTTMTQFWAPDLDNSANKKFVEGFKEKYENIQVSMPLRVTTQLCLSRVRLKRLTAISAILMVCVQPWRKRIMIQFEEISAWDRITFRSRTSIVVKSFKMQTAFGQLQSVKPY